jgi:hypothetical protein
LVSVVFGLVSGPRGVSRAALRQGGQVEADLMGRQACSAVAGAAVQPGAVELAAGALHAVVISG